MKRTNSAEYGESGASQREPSDLRLERFDTTWHARFSPSRVLVVSVLAIEARVLAGGFRLSATGLHQPEHGGYFMGRLFVTPAAALASVDDGPVKQQPTGIRHRPRASSQT